MTGTCVKETHRGKHLKIPLREKLKLRVVRVTPKHREREREKQRERERERGMGKGVNLGDEKRDWSAQFLHIWGLGKAIFAS